MDRNESVGNQLSENNNKDSGHDRGSTPTSEDPVEFFDAEEDIDNDSENKETEEELLDDLVDEEKLKEEELGLTEIQLQERLVKAKELKEKGNEEFKNEQYRDSILSYTKGLLLCPLLEKDFRSVLYSNRSAAKVKLGVKESALEDCSKSLENNPNYMKVLLRRAKLYEESEKLDEALVDYTKIVELDPGNKDAFFKTKELPGQINERNEKLKTEMLGKLKDLGNMVLRPFGLSTNNFQLQQDPNSGGYSVNFQK